MKGKFITLEGPEGSGKTTVSNRIVKMLEEKGLIVKTRCEDDKRN